MSTLTAVEHADWLWGWDAQYLATRASRQELACEALLAAGAASWSIGEHVRIYRTTRGGARTIEDDGADPRDYDSDYYVRVLRDHFANRLIRAFTPEDYAAIFADPDQLSLFAPALERVRPILSCS